MRINLKYQNSYKVLCIIRMIYNRYVISRVALLIILQNVLIKHISQSMMNNTQWFLCIRAVWKKMKYIGLIKMPKSLALQCGSGHLWLEELNIRYQYSSEHLFLEGKKDAWL